MEILKDKMRKRFEQDICGEILEDYGKLPIDEYLVLKIDRRYRFEQYLSLVFAPAKAPTAPAKASVKKLKSVKRGKKTYRKRRRRKN
jgi:hypothetical protein